MIEIAIQTVDELVTVVVQDVPPIPLPAPEKPFWDFKSTLNTTEATGFGVSTVATKLPNNAGIDNYFFGDKASLYNPVTQRLVTNQLNAFYLVAISFKAKTNSNNTWVECYLRAGDGSFSKRPQSEFIVRGANVENDMHILLEYYAGPALINVGFEIFINSNNPVTIWDIDYTVKML